MDALAIDPWIGFPLLLVVGVVAGALNAVAGGGSFLTLPALIFFGLPAGVANGTNRIGVVLQGISSTWSFHRDRVLDLRLAAWATLPAAIGAVLGVGLALRISDEGFEKVLAVLMVVISLVSFWKPKPPEEPEATHRGLLVLGYFLAGIYGGFVQAGVGFLLLAVTTFAGLDLVRGNAVKVVAVLGFTSVALALFVWQGRVEWLPGVVLGVGNLVGGYVGARWAVLKGHDWIRIVVTVAILVFAVKLWIA